MQPKTFTTSKPTPSLTAKREEALVQARELLQNTERILIGAGAGLSSAAGLMYTGERFRHNFEPFIRRYGMTDMYSAGFYPFATEEDRWAYWAQHVWVNRFEPPALALYTSLWEALREKDYFVITTNVDAQFEKAGFKRDAIFATQGDYGFMQCARGCHERIYPNRALVENILAATREGDPTRAPSKLVPHCPVCGAPMVVHLRCDGFFVEDDAWRAAQRRYQSFIDSMRNGHGVLLELGVGWNTPSIIRLPFERLASRTDIPLVRMNLDDARITNPSTPQNASLEGDIATLWPRIAPATSKAKALHNNDPHSSA